MRAIGGATVIFDKKACAITSKDKEVGGEIKNIQPLVLPDPESIDDSDEESIEDAVYDEDYRGGHNLTEKNTLKVVSISRGAIEIFFHLYVLGHIHCYIENVFNFFRRKRIKIWRKRRKRK